MNVVAVLTGIWQCKQCGNPNGIRPIPVENTPEVLEQISRTRAVMEGLQEELGDAAEVHMAGQMLSLPETVCCNSCGSEADVSGAVSLFHSDPAGSAMQKDHADWIAANAYDMDIPVRGLAYSMRLTFPDLSIVYGSYLCPILGEQRHWWLFDAERGVVVDPGYARYPSRGTGGYGTSPIEEWPLKPVGRCLFCRSYVYNDTYQGCCTQRCQESFDAHWETIRVPT